MNKKGVAGIVLAGAAFGLTSCGGSSDPGTSQPDTKLSTDGATIIGASNSVTQIPTSGADSSPVQGPDDGPNDNSSQLPDDVPESGPGAGCTEAINRCLDATNLQIAKYQDNKQAAASYTFDDGYETSFKIASIFEKLGLRASFYIIAGKVADSDWARWKALAENGHEVGTHSMTHTIDLGNPNLSNEQLDVEINQAQRIIGQKIGIMPKVFAFPWHSYTDRSRGIALQNHIAIRSPGPDDTDYTLAFFDQDHNPDLAKTLATVNTQLSDSIANGGWFVAAGHGLDGDGWSPVTTQFLEDHLAFAAEYSSMLWTDTYLNVARYRLCRKLLTAKATIDSAQQITVRLVGDYDPAVCNAPLTVTIPVNEIPARMLRAETVTGAPVTLQYSGNALLVNIVPGNDVSVKIGAYS